MKRNSNVYDWLDEVRKRPGMYIRDGHNLGDLETLMHGYYAALHQHGISEDVPRLNKSQFADWLNKKTGIGSALGWAHILNEKYPDPEIAFLKFFEYIEKYKRREQTASEA